MRYKIGEREVRLLMELKKNPLNLRIAAAQAGFSYATAWRRIKDLRKFIRIGALPSYFKLGLQPVVVLVSGYDVRVEDLLRVGYTRSVTRYFTSKGYLTLLEFLIPRNLIHVFRDYIKRTMKERVIKYIELACIRMGPSNPRPILTEVKIDWNEIMKKIEEGARREYRPFYAPGIIAFDDKDLVIMAELEKDSLVTLKSVASKTSMTKELVYYHYKRHVLDRELIEDFYFDATPPFLAEEPVWLILCNFTKPEYINPLVSALRDVLFVKEAIISGMGDVALVRVQAPCRELYGIVKICCNLVNEGSLESFEYLIQDAEYEKTFPLPYEMYKEGEWVPGPRLEELVRETS